MSVAVGYYLKYVSIYTQNKQIHKYPAGIRQKAVQFDKRYIEYDVSNVILQEGFEENLALIPIPTCNPSPEIPCRISFHIPVKWLRMGSRSVKPVNFYRVAVLPVDCPVSITIYW